MCAAGDATRDHELEERSRPGPELPAGASEERRRLAEHVEAIREEERARLALEIHDELGQMLTALKLDVGWIRRWLDAHETEARPLVSRVEAMAVLVDELLAATRLLARQLRPVALDELGLEAAARALVAEVGGWAGLVTSLRTELAGMPADRERDAAAYRILQEALTNVARHAAARRVEVVLSYRRGQLELRVSDDGAGLPDGAARAATPMGLTGMRERARALSGEARWSRGPEGGTTVTVRLPDRPPLTGSGGTSSGR